ncbi:MAG: arylsulfatase, partial [Cyclobacteriaceae bacterium]|nr:arylsulfatase [Cyclobacteriaceae bacterium]
MKKLLILPFMALLALSCTEKDASTRTTAKGPNIILIMTDDQGHGDLGFYGNPDIKTPTMDSLAGISARFTQFYVSPVCAPTRSSLMTGRYSLRTGVYDTYNGGAIMAANETTIAEVLRDNGYMTGIFGKWHLGDTYPHRPADQGFEESLIHAAGGMGQVGDVFNFFEYDSAYFNPIVLHNNVQVKTKGYCSDVFTDGAVDFIEKNKENPFFLYLSFNAPHTPLQLPAKYQDMYADLEIDSGRYDNGTRPFPKMDNRSVDAARRVYGMVSNIDDNLARLFNKVNELGIRDNTLIIFMTDNGPQQLRYVSGMRGRKGTVYEGGIHVPFFISWPGKIAENKELKVPAVHMDIFPTLLNLCGIAQPEGLDIDGQDLTSVLNGDTPPWANRPLVFYWQRGYDGPYHNIAVRSGNYKLVGHTDAGSAVDEFELFNLADDPGEMTNIVGNETKKATELIGIFDDWYANISQAENLINFPRIVIGSP